MQINSKLNSKPYYNLYFMQCTCSKDENNPVWINVTGCDLLAAIFVMLKILRLLFVARIELFNSNGPLAPVKTKTTTGACEA